MLFNSYDFLFFFPIVWGIWALLRRLGRFRICLGILVATSFVFYGFYDWKLCLLLGSSIGVNYVLHRLLISDKRTGWQRYALLFAGLLFNVGLLFYFKYLDFTIENVNRVIRADIPLRGNVLPLGISFYTFQQLSFVIDSYYRRMKAGVCRICFLLSTIGSRPHCASSGTDSPTEGAEEVHCFGRYSSGCGIFCNRFGKEDACSRSFCQVGQRRFCQRIWIDRTGCGIDDFGIYLTDLF